MKQDLDLELQMKVLEKVINKNYVIPRSRRFFDSMETLAQFIIICLAIIFRPLTIIAGGLIAITIILLI